MLNVQIIGSPVINGSNVSGFSSDSFLALPNMFNETSTNWEMAFKIRTGDVVNVQQVIIGMHPDAEGLFFGGVVIEFGRMSNNVFSMAIASGTNAWDISDHVTGKHKVLPNTDYWIKLVFTGTSYNFYYSLDGETYINDITVGSNKKASPYTGGIGIFLTGGATYVLPLLGSIDLSQCYIKTGGKLWWVGEIQKTKFYVLNSNNKKYIISKRSDKTKRYVFQKQ